jgi:hypothetical protein
VNVATLNFNGAAVETHGMESQWFTDLLAKSPTEMARELYESGAQDGSQFSGGILAALNAKLIEANLDLSRHTRRMATWTAVLALATFALVVVAVLK